MAGFGASPKSRSWRIVLSLTLVLVGLTFQIPSFAGSHLSVRAEGVTDSSWNSAVTCSATVTTIEQVLGNGSYASGGFRPGIPDKRSTTPPCSVNLNATFVEIRNIRIVQYSLAHEDYALYPNGNFSDTTATLEDPSCPFTNSTRCHIFVEIDRAWKANGIAPSDPLTTTNLDVQGFVYWNPSGVGQAWHSYTGWEIHPITATRPVGQVFATTLGTFFWTTVLLAIAFVILFILYAERAGLISLRTGHTVPSRQQRRREGVETRKDGDESASLGLLTSFGSVPGGPGVEAPKEGASSREGLSGAYHDWSRHLTMSLALLSTSFAILLGWEYENNVYAQVWVSQHIVEASLLSVLIAVTVTLLPVTVLIMPRLTRKKNRT